MAVLGKQAQSWHLVHFIFHRLQRTGPIGVGDMAFESCVLQVNGRIICCVIRLNRGVATVQDDVRTYIDSC